MLTAIALLITYSIALIVAGDGAAPMALLLLWGDLESWWVAGKIPGWIGIVGLVCATFLLRSTPLKRLTCQFLASLILYFSWLVVAIRGNDSSGSFFSSFVLSAPFQITFFVVASRLILQLKQVRAELNGSP